MKQKMPDTIFQIFVVVYLLCLNVLSEFFFLFFNCDSFQTVHLHEKGNISLVLALKDDVWHVF